MTYEIHIIAALAVVMVGIMGTYANHFWNKWLLERKENAALKQQLEQAILSEAQMRSMLAKALEKGGAK